MAAGSLTSGAGLRALCALAVGALALVVLWPDVAQTPPSDRPAVRVLPPSGPTQPPAPEAATLQPGAPAIRLPADVTRSPFGTSDWSDGRATQPSSAEETAAGAAPADPPTRTGDAGPIAAASPPPAPLPRPVLRAPALAELAAEPDPAHGPPAPPSDEPSD